MIEIVRGGLAAQVLTPLGELPERKQQAAIVVGCAPGWEEHFAKFVRPRTKVDVVASNDAIKTLGAKVTHAASLNGSGGYLSSMSLNAKHVHTSMIHGNEHHEMFRWSFDYEYRYPPDSGVFSMLVAYMLGYESITLCGVCLDSGTWYERGQDHFTRLVKLMPDVEIKSLFGWTKDELQEAGAC